MNAPSAVLPRKRKPSDDTPRVTVFLDRALVDWLEGQAKREDRSRNYIIVRLLRQAMLAEQNASERQTKMSETIETIYERSNG